MKKTYLLLGGAGYIGSHTALALIDLKQNVIIVDNLSTGNLKLINNKAKFYKANYDDDHVLNKIFLNYKIDTIFLFAGSILVNESINFPLKYYENNVKNFINLLSTLALKKFKNFVFSSSAAVYGSGSNVAIKEDDIKNPISPYGNTKLIGELLLQDFAKAYKINVGILRYFNVAGNDIYNRIGLMTKKNYLPTHLIPTIIDFVFNNKKDFIINGKNFNTFDGTCVRDYIHVSDLAQAHILTANALKNNFQLIFNVGSNCGYSNLEIVQNCEKILNQKINYQFGPKRIGDPAFLIADCSKIRKILNFKPQFSILDIIQTEINWKKKQGYKLFKK